MKYLSRIIVAVALTATFAPTPARGVTITEFPVPTAASQPRGITAGPDGNLWFTESLGNKIGRSTTAGVITEFPIPTPNSFPLGITSGPDGNLWFAEGTGNKIGSITTAGVITEYTVPTAASSPRSIVSGPDGRLWFTEGTADKIGAVTTLGVFTEYPIPGAAGALARGLAVGPDGNLWFTEEAGGRIGKLTTTGTFTMYTPPTAASGPIDIVAGPDGNLWFAQANAVKIAKVTTAGVFTEYPVPTAASQPRGIAAGPDGNLWFAEFNGNNLGRITTAGVVTEYPTPTAGSNPIQVANGPDGNLWFTEHTGNRIGVITDPSFATCGNGVTGVDEICDDGNLASGDCCSSTCAYEAADAPCTTDSNACTKDVCDGAGSCDHLEVPIDPLLCYVAPSTKLQIKDSATAGKDKLSWDWGKGEAFAQAALGTPNTAMGTSYTLCVYDNTTAVSALKAAIDIAPSPTLWVTKDPKGLQYKDKEGTSEGVTKAQLKTGDAAKTKVKLSAKGINLVLPAAASGSTFFDSSNVIAQLVSSDGECWTSEFTPADTKLNAVDSFKAQTK
jgi:cysteine-rich repeat protein